MRELHGRDADAARGAVDENGFARLRVGSLKERAVRRAVRHAERGALTERRLRRQQMELRRRAERAFAVRPRAGDGVARSRNVHAIAGAKILDVRADRFHFARAVEAGRVRQRRLAAVIAGRDVDVDGIDARRTNANDEVTRAGFRIRHVFELQNFRSAERMDSYGFHDSLARLKARAPITTERPTPLGRVAGSSTQRSLTGEWSGAAKGQNGRPTG